MCLHQGISQEVTKFVRLWLGTMKMLHFFAKQGAIFMTRASRRFQVLVYLVHRGSGSCGTRIFMAAKRTSPFWISKNRIGVPLIRRSYVFIVRTCHRRHDTYARAGSKSLTRSGECTFDWPLGRQVRKGLFCAKRTFSIYIYTSRSSN